MSFPQQELTTHLDYHSPALLDDSCVFCEMYTTSMKPTPKENLFSANHRNLMMRRYGYTDALNIYITPSGNLEYEKN